MNIFGVGGAELVLIIVIMLIVAGPKRMIRWAYYIGQYVGKFRILWEQMVDVLQDEVDAAGLDVKLPKDIPTRQNIAKTAGELLKPYTDQVEKSLEEVKNPVQAAIDEGNSAVKDVKKETEKSVDFGAWDGKAEAESDSQPDEQPVEQPVEQAVEPESAPESVNIPASNYTPANFGAWSQPKSPDSQVEQEA